MKLLEHQAKEVFKKHRIPIPKGHLIREKNQMQEVFDSLEFRNGVFLKAQVKTGGRGKAGGIKFAASLSEAIEIYDQVNGLKIGGYEVSDILIEEKVSSRQKEFFIGLTIDPIVGQPVLLISSQGGVDVEDIAQQSPRLLERAHVDITFGILDYKIREMLIALGISKNLFKQFTEISKKLYKIFMNHEATRVEINPLILNEEGVMIAADGRLSIDDAAVFRHPELSTFKNTQEDSSDEEYLRDQHRIEYVELSGNIGLISGGAGMTMTAMDMIASEGGKPACFMDCSANVSTEGYEIALRTVSSKKGVSSILINIFGGLTRMDLVGDYLVKAINKIGNIHQPITIRLEGTDAEKGRKTVEAAGLNTCNSFEAAVKMAVDLGDHA